MYVPPIIHVEIYMYITNKSLKSFRTEIKITIHISF